MDIGSEPTIFNMPFIDASVLGVHDLIFFTFAKIVTLDPKAIDSIFLVKSEEVIIYFNSILIFGLITLIYLR